MSKTQPNENTSVPNFNKPRLSLKEVGQYLDVGYSTVKAKKFEWAEQGVRMYRFGKRLYLNRADLDQLVEQGQIN